MDSILLVLRLGILRAAPFFLSSGSIAPRALDTQSIRKVEVC